MQERRVELPRDEGLHARPVGELSLSARRFESDVAVRRPGSAEAADAKSPVALVAQAFGTGEELEVIAWGPDECEAVGAVEALVESWG